MADAVTRWRMANEFLVTELSFARTTVAKTIRSLLQLYQTDDPDVDSEACWNMLEEDHYRCVVERLLELQTDEQIEMEKVRPVLDKAVQDLPCWAGGLRRSSRLRRPSSKAAMLQTESQSAEGPTIKTAAPIGSHKRKASTSEGPKKRRSIANIVGCAAPRAIADLSRPMPVTRAEKRPKVDQSSGQAKYFHPDELLGDREVGSPAGPGHSGVSAPSDQLEDMTNGVHFQTILLPNTKSSVLPGAEAAPEHPENNAQFLVIEKLEYMRRVKDPGKVAFIENIPRNVENTECYLNMLVKRILDNFEFAPFGNELVKEVVYPALNRSCAFVRFKSEAVVEIFYDYCLLPSSNLEVNGKQLVVKRFGQEDVPSSPSVKHLLAQARGRSLIPGDIVYLGNISASWHDETALRCYFEEVLGSLVRGRTDTEVILSVYLLPEHSNAFLHMASRAMADVLLCRCKKVPEVLEPLGSSVLLCRHPRLIPTLGFSQAVWSSIGQGDKYKNQRTLQVDYLPASKENYCPGRLVTLFEWIVTKVRRDGVVEAALESITWKCGEQKAMVFFNSELTANIIMDMYLASPESCMLEGGPYFLLSRHCQYVRPGAVYKEVSEVPLANLSMVKHLEGEEYVMNREGYKVRAQDIEEEKSLQEPEHVLFCDTWVCVRGVDMGLSLHPLHGLLNELFERELASSSSLELGTQVITEVSLKEGTDEIFIRLTNPKAAACLLAKKQPMKVMGTTIEIFPLQPAETEAVTTQAIRHNKIVDQVVTQEEGSPHSQSNLLGSLHRHEFLSPPPARTLREHELLPVLMLEPSPIATRDCQKGHGLLTDPGYPRHPEDYELPSDSIQRDYELPPDSIQVNMQPPLQGVHPRPPSYDRHSTQWHRNFQTTGPDVTPLLEGSLYPVNPFDLVERPVCQGAQSQPHCSRFPEESLYHSDVRPKIDHRPSPLIDRKPFFPPATKSEWRQGCDVRQAHIPPSSGCPSWNLKPRFPRQVVKYPEQSRQQFKIISPPKDSSSNWRSIPPRHYQLPPDAQPPQSPTLLARPRTPQKSQPPPLYSQHPRRPTDLARPGTPPLISQPPPTCQPPQSLASTVQAKQRTQPPLPPEPPPSIPPPPQSDVALARPRERDPRRRPSSKCPTGPEVIEGLTGRSLQPLILKSYGKKCQNQASFDGGGEPSAGRGGVESEEAAAAASYKDEKERSREEELAVKRRREEAVLKLKYLGIL